MGIIKADPTFSDLTVTQYLTGLDWLREIGVVTQRGPILSLSPVIEPLSPAHVTRALFSAALAHHAPSWLPEADTLITDAESLPQDADDLARVLGLAADAAFAEVRHLWSKVDSAELERVGAAGESALLDVLERRWPGSTVRVSLQSDTYGYDLLFRLEALTWHLEVKTTPRRGRLAIYLSRHECDVAVRDPLWRLVVVGLESDGTIGALATAPTGDVLAMCPSDTSAHVQWRMARFHLRSTQLNAGLAFLPISALEPTDQLFAVGSRASPSRFAWMP